MFTSNSISILPSKTDATSVIFKGINTPLTHYKNSSNNLLLTKRKTFRHKDFKNLASGNQSISIGNQLSDTYKGFIDNLKKTFDQMFNLNESPKLKDLTFDPNKIKDAILVFGSAGKTGRLLIKELMNCGRPVIVTTRRAEKLYELKSEIGKSDNLYFADNVDITDPSTMPKKLFQGVNQVVMCHGPVFKNFGNELPTSLEELFADNMTPERVYDEGIKNVVELVSQYMDKNEETTKEIISLNGTNNISKWSSLDDVIMGGKSNSQIKANSDNTGAIFSGNLITEGGGFCSVLAKNLKLDLSDYDGICLKVKGNGQRFKFKLKTSDISEDSFEYDFQAVFDTLEEGYTNVKIAWHEFVQTVRSTIPHNAKKLDPSKITAFGIILSRFGFNGQPNLKCKPGPFSLEIDSGISVFKLQRPNIILLSSGALERNAIIRDDEDKRKKEINIIKLNPGNILNYLYKGENYVRASGIPYTIIRPVGLFEKKKEEVMVEVSQGDRFKGRTTRENCAKMIASILKTPYCCYKTFEMRDGLGLEHQEIDYSDENVRRLMLSLHKDDERTMYGIRPFPSLFMVNENSNENK